MPGILITGKRFGPSMSPITLTSNFMTNPQQLLTRGPIPFHVTAGLAFLGLNPNIEDGLVWAFHEYGPIPLTCIHRH